MAGRVAGASPFFTGRVIELRNGLLFYEKIEYPLLVMEIRIANIYFSSNSSVEKSNS